MDCRTALFICLIALLTTFITISEGISMEEAFLRRRNKKVVIHVPFKVKKMKHTHTVFRTVHHHHIDHAAPPPDEHEHFHRLHLHDEPTLGQHSQPVPGIGIPEFLPDVPLNIPDVPSREISGMPNRHGIPLYRRNI